MNEKNLKELEHKNILHIDSVYKSYGAKCILDNIDLSVAEGEFCTVVGPSGCGKSTLLRLILGQEAPSEGRITIENEHCGFANTERGIVYQKYSLFPNKTVLNNVLLGKQLQQNFFKRMQNKKQDREEAMFYLKKMNLENAIHKYPHELSGGMQQRVAIAQALIMKHKILLMDEPFGALDPGTREGLQTFMLELWEEMNMTIFFVTHDLEEALFLGTRLIALSQYYSDDRKEDPNRGAKIVCDYHVGNIVHSTKSKARKEFTDMIQKIRTEAFDPYYLQHVQEFNLKHDDSFQTLTSEEHTSD